MTNAKPLETSAAKKAIEVCVASSHLPCSVGGDAFGRSCTVSFRVGRRKAISNAMSAGRIMEAQKAIL